MYLLFSALAHQLISRDCINWWALFCIIFLPCHSKLYSRVFFLGNRRNFFFLSHSFLNFKTLILNAFVFPILSYNEAHFLFLICFFFISFVIIHLFNDLFAFQLREAQSRVEELETSNMHLHRRLDKLKSAKSTLLKEL